MISGAVRFRFRFTKEEGETTMASRHFLSRLTVAAVPAGIALALAVLFTPSLLADGGDPTVIHACVKNVKHHPFILQ